MADTTTTLTLTVTIENSAAANANNQIPAVLPTEANYDLTFQLSDVDLSSGAVDTLGNTVFVPTSYISDISVGLTTGGATLDIISNVDMTFPSAQCGRISFMCATLTTGIDALYIDADTNVLSNVVCMIATQLAQCTPGKY